MGKVQVSCLILACGVLSASMSSAGASDPGMLAPIVVAQSRALEQSIERNRQRQEERSRLYQEQQAEQRRAQYNQRLQDLREAVAKDQSLGFMSGPVPEPMRSRFNVPAHIQGVLVSDVIPQSAAERAGIQQGDVIYRVGNATLQSDTDFKREFDAVKGSRSTQFRVSTYNIKNGATREATIELPKGMVASADDLVGNEAAALYAVGIPTFVAVHCPQLMPNWSRVSDLLRQFRVDAATIKNHAKYKSQMDQWKETAKGSATALCEDLIRTTYSASLGGHMLTGIINRR